MKISIVILLMMTPLLTHAVDLECSGPINRVLIYNNGSVKINPQWRPVPQTLCNMFIDYQSITPNVCAAWVNIIESIRAQGKDVVINYGDNTGYQCDNTPSFDSAPVPVFITAQ